MKRTELGLRAAKSAAQSDGRVDVMWQADAIEARRLRLEMRLGRFAGHAAPVPGCRVLVMDDNVSVLTSMRYMLETCGCRATVVRTGEECVEAYRSASHGLGRFDLVILDLENVEGRGGLWTLRELQKLDPKVAVVLATANDPATSSAVSDHRSIGFRACLEKPFGMHELLASIQQVLRSGTGSLHVSRH